jgi:hypothetical protein
MALGMTAASMAVLQNGMNRLMGYKENAREVKIYGTWPVQPEIKPNTPGGRYPIATGLTSPSVTPPLDWKNYN